MQIRIRLSGELRQSVIKRLAEAYRSGQLYVVKRLHAILLIVEGKSVADVAAVLSLGSQTVRAYLCAFLLRGLDSLHYKRPPGRPAKLTKTQRKELAELIVA